MGIIDTVIENLKTIFLTPIPSAPQQAPKPNLLLFQGSDGGGRTEPRGYLTSWYYRAPFGQPRGINLTEIRELAKSPFVNMCIKTIIDEVSSIDFQVVPKENGSEAHADQVMDFFEHPNKNDENFKQIERAVCRDILEIDAGVIEKVFTQGENLIELYARDGASFIIDTDKHGIVHGYYQYSKINPSMEAIEFRDRDIVYIKQHPRSDSVYGQSPVEILHTIIKTLMNSIDWNYLYFQENAVPSGVLSIVGMSEYEKTQFEEYWKTKIKGRPHKMPIVHSEVKWQPFTTTMEDLQFLESQAWYAKLVMACFGVTPNELGFTENVNKAVSYSQSKIFRRKAVRPICDLLEYHINLEIVSEFYDDVEFKFIPATDLDEEIQKRSIWEKEIRTGLRTINEIREDDLGLKPVHWGDAPMLQPLSNPQQPAAGYEVPRENVEQAVSQLKLLLQSIPEDYAKMDAPTQQDILNPILEVISKIENGLLTGESLSNLRTLLNGTAEQLNLNDKTRKMREIEDQYGESIEKLLLKWRNRGLSSTQIAEKCGLKGHSTVLDWLKRFGIE